MGPGKLRKAIESVKDQASIRLAKIRSGSSLSDLDVAIVRATLHEEYPPDERYVRVILDLTSRSHAHVSACVDAVVRRLSKTRNWVVALKALSLVQRLLSEGDPAFEEEVFFASRRGTRLLNMSSFRDKSGHSNSWSYTAFVRTYALYLDERLEFRMQGRRGTRSGFGYRERGEKEEEEISGGGASRGTVVKTALAREMKMESLLCMVHHLMQILERFLACKPTGCAKDNIVVTAAFYHILKESFQLYLDILEIMSIFLDRLPHLNKPDSTKVSQSFICLSKRLDELDSLYNWCKTDRIARSSEFPNVEKIPKSRLDMLEQYIQQKSFKPQKTTAPTTVEPKPEPVVDENTNTIKALPPPEPLVDESGAKQVTKSTLHAQMGDLLNLGEHESHERGNELELALFGSSLPTAATPWEAFKDTSGDWETALVQTASHLSNQRASLPRGFDAMILDGLYQQGIIASSVATSSAGSVSSVAYGSAGNPSLPAPSSCDVGGANSDPFAASLGVAPPSYVQMWEIEKKQRLLREEQAMWQQYARDGMQGAAGMSRMQPHGLGSYAGTY